MRAISCSVLTDGRLAYVPVEGLAVVRVVFEEEEEECDGEESTSPYALALPVWPLFAGFAGGEVFFGTVRDGKEEREPEGALVGKAFRAGNALVLVVFV